MSHGLPKGAWLLLAVLVVPASGVALRHAVGPAARPDGGPTNARIWVSDLPGRMTGVGSTLVTVRTLGLIPEGNGAEVPLTSPNGGPMQFDLRTLRDGHVALAGAGIVPAGHYTALHVELADARLDLPLTLTLDVGREVDLLLDLDPLARSRSSARIASLRQR